MGPGPRWTRPRPAPLLRVWVLFFETHRIRVGSESRKYVTGPGPGLKVQTRTRTQTRPRDPDPKLAPQTQTRTWTLNN